MATIKRYEAPADRVRLLYRIPHAPNGGRTLELYNTVTPVLADDNWPGTNKTLCRVGPGKPAGLHDDHLRDCHDQNYLDFHGPLPFANQSFDLVILHRTLDDLALLPTSDGLGFQPILFFKNVSAVLATDGIVAGCVNNRWSLKRCMARLRHLFNPTQLLLPTGHFTLQSLRETLSAAGYSEVRLFTLIPNSSTPFKLIDTDPAISRAAFLQELQITRHLALTPGYLVRRAMVEFGMNRHLEESTFFWARKSC